MKFAFVLLSTVMTFAAEGPQQPIPYSHKTHVALGLKCRECHAMPEPGEMMTIPAPKKCMSCHASVKADSPAIQKLAGFAASGRQIPWVRVYQIPGFVFFSHKAHLNAGADCQKCHGPVQERERLARETDISMGGCMNCHRETKASLSCTYCHEELK